MHPSARETQNDKNHWLHWDTQQLWLYKISSVLEPNIKKDASTQMYDVIITIYICSSDVALRQPNEWANFIKCWDVTSQFASQEIIWNYLQFVETKIYSHVHKKQ